MGGVTDAEGRIGFPALYVGEWACEVGRARIPALTVTGDPLQSVELIGLDCIAGSVRWASPNERSLKDVTVTLSVGELTRPTTVLAEEDGRFRFDFVPTDSNPTVGAYSGDSFLSIDGEDAFFSAGAPVAAVPGAMDLLLSLTPAERKDQVKIQRREISRRALNFDK